MSEDLNTVATAGESQKTNPWVIVAIIAVALLCCCIIMFVIIPGIFVLIGPAVGDVFSNIIEELGTPVP